MKRTFQNTSLVIFSVLLVFLSAEIVLRLTGYDVVNYLRNGREMIIRSSDTPDLKYELIPGAKAFAWKTDIEINARGYRGRAGIPGKFDGFRVVSLGDSIAFGNYLPVEATYAAQLHKMLNGGPKRYEVLNFGVGGYDILQSVALLKARCLVYKPDLVVVGFCLNDVGVVSANLEYIERVQKRKSGLFSKIRLIQFFLDRFDRKTLKRATIERNKPEVFAKDYATKILPIGGDETLAQLMGALPRVYPSWWYKSEARIGRLRYAFEELAALGKSEQFNVVIVIFPWLEGTSDSYPHHVAHSIVAHEAQRVGFDLIDLADDFCAAGMESLRVAGYDLIHPNAKGNALAAQKLAEYIRRIR